MKTRILFAAAVLLLALPAAARCQVVPPVDPSALAADAPPRIGPSDQINTKVGHRPLTAVYPAIDLGALDLKLCEPEDSGVKEFAKNVGYVMYLGQTRWEKFRVPERFRGKAKASMNWYLPGEKMPVHHNADATIDVKEMVDSFKPPKTGKYFVQFTLQDRDTGAVLAHSQQEFFVIPKE